MGVLLRSASSRPTLLQPNSGVRKMKQCPKCDFTFADFHHLCDFDGTELVPVLEQSSLVNRSTPSRCRRMLKSPLFSMGVATLGLLASALLIGYYDSVNQSPPVVQTPTPPASISSANPVPRVSDQSFAPIKTSASSKHSSSRKPFPKLRRKPTASRSHARLHQKIAAGNHSRKSQTAQRKEPEQTSPEKEPKLTAMLKTTWRFLKRPFKF